MENCPESNALQLLCVVVDLGTGSQVLRIARRTGVSGGIILLGKGTVRSRMLTWLDVREIRKEVVLMLADPELAKQAVLHLEKEMKLSQPHHGIAFTLLVSDLVGSHYCRLSQQNIEGGDPVMYKAIIVIVDRGAAETVVESAERAGSNGATILNARGSGAHETSRLFAMEIEPEKEMVLILTKAEQYDTIVQAIKRDIKLAEPGNGILFAVDVLQTFGLFEATQNKTAQK